MYRFILCSYYRHIETNTITIFFCLIDYLNNLAIFLHKVLIILAPNNINILTKIFTFIFYYYSSAASSVSQARLCWARSKLTFLRQFIIPLKILLWCFLRQINSISNQGVIFFVLRAGVTFIFIPFQVPKDILEWFWTIILCM